LDARFSSKAAVWHSAQGPVFVCKNRVRMADQGGSHEELEDRVESLAEVVDRLIGVVSKLDDETSDTAAAAFDSDVPRVAGHKATAEELKSLRQTLDALRKA
jgi:hypothetical protein